jgi:hypothetical protein
MKIVFLLFLWQDGYIKNAVVDYSMNAFRNLVTSFCLLMPTALALTEKHIVHRKRDSFCCSTFVKHNFCAGKRNVLNKIYLEINVREARRNWHKWKAKWLNKFLWSYPVQNFIILHSVQWRTEGGVWSVQPPPPWNSEVLTKSNRIANWVENV